MVGGLRRGLALARSSIHRRRCRRGIIDECGAVRHATIGHRCQHHEVCRSLQSGACKRNAERTVVRGNADDRLDSSLALVVRDCQTEDPGTAGKVKFCPAAPSRGFHHGTSRRRRLIARHGRTGECKPVSFYSLVPPDGWPHATSVRASSAHAKGIESPQRRKAVLISSRDRVRFFRSGALHSGIPKSRWTDPHPILCRPTPARVVIVAGEERAGYFVTLPFRGAARVRPTTC